MDLVLEGNSSGLDFLCGVTDVDFEEILSAAPNASLSRALSGLGYAEYPSDSD